MNPPACPITGACRQRGATTVEQALVVAGVAAVAAAAVALYGLPTLYPDVVARLATLLVR